MSEATLQGMGTPFPILVKAKKRVEKVEFDQPEGDEILSEIQGDHRYHVYGAAWWMVSGKGRGCDPFKADMKGSVYADVRCPPIYAGTPGAKPHAYRSKQGELDLTGVVIDRLSRGYVRVDHLKDEKGVVLGLPSVVEKDTAKGSVGYTKRLLNPHRIAQLQAELADSAEGRSLVGESFKPRPPRMVEDALSRKSGKEESQRKEDRAILDQIQKDMDALAALVTVGLKTYEDNLKAVTTPVKGGAK